MKEQLKKLLVDLQAKSNEIKELTAREQFTGEDLARVKTLQGECDGLKTEIEKFNTAEAARIAAEENLKFLNEPATGFGVGLNTTSRAEVLGMTPDGEVVIDRTSDRFKMFYSSGQCLLDEKQLAAISTNTYKDAFFDGYVRHGGNLYKLSAAQLKVLSDGADTGGGYLVPEEVLAQLIMKKPTPTRLRGKVTELNTGRDNLVIPRVNYSADDLYTTGIRVTWTEEIPNSATQARVNFPDATAPQNNGFGQVRVQIYTAMMSIPITNDQLEDSLFPMASWIGDKFGETIDLLYDNMILNGTGVGQPYGILSNPGGTGQPAVVTVGNPPTGDGLIKLAYSLPEQYEDRAEWIFNKTNTANYVRRLKDSQNRYLFGEGTQESGLAYEKPKTLAGYGFTYSGFMPNTTQSDLSTVIAGNYPFIFGDLRGYYLVNRIGFSVQILDQPYAELNQKVMLGRIRFGGQVAEDWRIKVGQIG